MELFKKRAYMVAWLITWESVNKEREIAAILNYRTSPEMIRRTVEVLYVNRHYRLSERLDYAKNTTNNPYPAEFERIRGEKWEGRVKCGHHPWLYARLVNNIRIDIDQNGNEILKWDERPLPEIFKGKI